MEAKEICEDLWNRLISTHKFEIDIATRDRPVNNDIEEVSISMDDWNETFKNISIDSLELETLFLSIAKPEISFMSIVYTPIVGAACLEFGYILNKFNHGIWININDAGELQQRCFSAKCKGADGNPKIFKITKVIKKIARNPDGIYLPFTTDTSLGNYFKEWSPLILAEADGKNVTWLMYSDVVGYWQRKSNNYFMKYNIQEFRCHVAKKFKRAIDKSDDPELIERAETIADKLSNTKSVKPFAECLKWLLEPDKDIEWNNKINYTVFPNGVLMMGVPDPDHPELPYKFGSTEPDDYISNAVCMRFPFNCPPVSMDGHYIQQAKEFLRSTLRKVQPDPEDRRLICTYMSLIFQAINFKKMVINIGKSGNNAKSSVFECLIYSAGSYGLTGDKKLIVKGKKDRVSVAELNMKRIVMFEEPDPSKGLDQEFLKDLIGGANKTTGRMLFSNKNQIVLHCKTILNANVMITVALESAILERLLYFIWSTRFTKDPRLVNPAERIYLAKEKFKTPAYWRSINDGLIWLLLNHYKIYMMNENTLQISPRQLARTKSQLLDADSFIKWFSSNYKLLSDVPVHKQ